FADCLRMGGNWEIVVPAGATLLALLALIATGRMSRHHLALATLPFGGIGVFFLQAKGFPYHLHPIAAGAHLAWLAVVTWAAEQAEGGRARIAALSCAALRALGCFWEVRTSAAAEHDWNVRGRTAADRTSVAYLDQFAWGDYFPGDLRRAATFLQR